MTQENKVVENAAMSAQEARQCIEEIKERLNRVRVLLLDLDERQGWKALGYESMEKCMVAEFERSRSQLYRELKAGRIERVLFQSPMGDEKIGLIPERQLRYIGQLPPERWLSAWNEILTTAPPKGVTTSHVEKVVTKIKNEGSSKQMATKTSEKTPERFIPVRDRKTIEENSFYEPGDMVVVACGAGVPLEWRRWNGYWGVVKSIGQSAGSVEVIVGGFPVRYKPSDLDPIDGSDADFKITTERINQLLWRNDLDESDRYLLETWYCKRLTFSDRQLKILAEMVSHYENQAEP